MPHGHNVRNSKNLSTLYALVVPDRNHCAVRALNLYRDKILNTKFYFDTKTDQIYLRIGDYLSFIQIIDAVSFCGTNLYNLASILLICCQYKRRKSKQLMEKQGKPIDTKVIGVVELFLKKYTQ